MQTVNYRNCKFLDCACGGDVIIGVAAELTVSTDPFIEGTITNVSEFMDACNPCCKCYIYAISYDEAQLVDPTALLTAVDITGVLCKGLLTDYIASFGVPLPT